MFLREGCGLDHGLGNKILFAGDGVGVEREQFIGTRTRYVMLWRIA